MKATYFYISEQHFFIGGSSRRIFFPKKKKLNLNSKGGLGEKDKFMSEIKVDDNVTTFEDYGRIVVDSTERVLRDYFDTGQLPSESIIILAFTTIVLISNLLTNVLNLAKLSEGLYTNISTGISKRHLEFIEYVENILYQLVEVTDTDRACIGLFHNSKTWGSVHFLKMSILYEARRDGVRSIRRKFQNVELEVIREEISISSSDRFIKLSATDERLSDSCKYYLTTVGINSVYTRKIVDKKGNILGIIELQNVVDRPRTDAVDSEVAEMLYRKLSTIVNRVKNKKQVKFKKDETR